MEPVGQVFSHGNQSGAPRLALFAFFSGNSLPEFEFNGGSKPPDGSREVSCLGIARRQNSAPQRLPLQLKGCSIICSELGQTIAKRARSVEFFCVGAAFLPDRRPGRGWLDRRQRPVLPASPNPRWPQTAVAGARWVSRAGAPPLSCGSFFRRFATADARATTRREKFPSAATWPPNRRSSGFPGPRLESCQTPARGALD